MPTRRPADHDTSVRIAYCPEKAIRRGVAGPAPYLSPLEGRGTTSLWLAVKPEWLESILADAQSSNRSERIFEKVRSFGFPPYGPVDCRRVRQHGLVRARSRIERRISGVGRRSYSAWTYEESIGLHLTPLRTGSPKRREQHRASRRIAPYCVEGEKRASLSRGQPGNPGRPQKRRRHPAVA
jgi:hypothetical protein